MGRFELGELVITSGVHSQMKTNRNFHTFVHLSLIRYKNCDWGDMCEEDKAANEEAVKNGEERIFGSYQMQDSDYKIWIITEWDRSYTTILFPDEY